MLLTSAVAQELVSYCLGTESSTLAEYERGGDGVCPFFAAGCTLLSVQPSLVKHLAPPSFFLRDATPIHAPELKCVAAGKLCRAPC